MTETLKPEGLSSFRRVSGDEAAGPILQRLKAGASLKDLQSDYALFTYAPLFLFGGLEHNPIQEWINKTNVGQVVFIFETEQPILQIGQGPRWDQLLWAVEKPHWSSLATHISSMSFINRSRKWFCRVLHQEIPVVDVAAKSTGEISTALVNITTFSIDSNVGCLAFKPGYMINKPAYLTVLPALTDTAKFADAILNEADKPYDTVQSYPWEAKK